VGEHVLGVARERIAKPAAARGVEPEHIAGTQRVIGVARWQALRRGGVRVDPEVAAAAVAAAGAAVWGIRCFMERIEKRASARLRYAGGRPGPPRTSPAPPESAISSKRVRRVGNSLSMISTGAILALLCLTVMPGAPSLPARARAPPAVISCCT